MKPYTQTLTSKIKPIVASPLGCAEVFLSVSYSGQYFRLSNGRCGFDSRHRYEAHPLDEALHAKKCRFDSDPVKAGSPMAEALIS